MTALRRLLVVVSLLAMASTAALAETGLEVRARLVEAEGKAGSPGVPAAPRVVGAPLVVEVEARHAPGRVALLPDRLELPEALGERRQARTHARRSAGDAELDVYRLELVPFEPGLIEVPPLPLALGSTVARTEPILVEVGSSLAPEEQDVASSTAAEALPVLENLTAGDPPPADVEVPDVRPAIAIIALAALLLAWVFGRRLLGRPRSAPVAPPPPARPAHEVALERLLVLSTSGLAERGEHNAYYTELSHVVRSYVGARYGFDALERTVDELVEALDRVSTPGLDRRDLQALLLEADQVKFAKYRPRPEDPSEALARARALVERTRADRPTQLEPSRSAEASG